SETHGIFATRTPNRPNPIGLTVAELIEKEGPVIRIKGITAIDGTPLLDIKPYFSATDSIPNARIEWFEKSMKQNG
ncbi:tRNA (N6-threonylcarbamoyladenosine(37)-N6)-methyltransferase TrmO, partial [candidate division KSB3 bacterium]